MPDPTIFEILLGKHSYGMTPEKETAWARMFILLGVVLGIFIGAVL